MSRLLPFTPDVTPTESAEPRLVDIDDDAADEVFDALGSATARTILSALHEEPRPASRLADATDTSVQNVQYHLGKLRGVGLVEVADTWYSERGREMKVYAPADESLVVFAGTDERDTFAKLLRRLVGAVVLVGVAWAALGRAGEWLPFGFRGGGDEGSPGGSPGSGVGDGVEATTGAPAAGTTATAGGDGAPRTDAPGSERPGTVVDGGGEGTVPGEKTSTQGETVTEAAESTAANATGTTAGDAATAGTDPAGTASNASAVAPPPGASADSVVDVASGWDALLSGPVPASVLLAVVAAIGAVVLVAALRRRVDGAAITTDADAANTNAADGDAADADAIDGAAPSGFASVQDQAAPNRPEPPLLCRESPYRQPWPRPRGSCTAVSPSRWR